MSSETGDVLLRSRNARWVLQLTGVTRQLTVALSPTGWMPFLLYSLAALLPTWPLRGHEPHFSHGARALLSF